MIDSARVLAIIPARGGSKGVPGKNIRLVAGRPLLAWTVEAARQATTIDRLILSSDDAEIIRVAAECGCEAPFVRAAELARDDTPGIAPVLDALERVGGYDVVVLLQPTSPLRTPADIDECVRLLVSSGAPACVSVTRCEEHPYWMYWVAPDRRLQRIVPDDVGGIARRQDLPTAYMINGAVYAASVQWLRSSATFLSPETIGYVMPPQRSLDIDTESDIQLAEAALRTTP
jgi:N-acylneuraminate cytidylyltransferase